MKKKNSSHPKLYIDLLVEGSSVNLYYLNNKFDENGKRIVLKQSKEYSNIFGSINSYLLKINQLEYRNLKKYIEIQKKVLEKHQKSGNYDSCKVVKESISLMKKFKCDFEDWFSKSD